MTGQIGDSVLFEGNRHEIAAIEGKGLFDPHQYEMATYSTCTACWRGFVVEYLCTNTQLLLKRLDINTRNPIILNGVSPGPGGHYCHYSYDDVNLPVPFTGKLLIAKDFIHSRYVHMGFQAPESYECVKELQIENGLVVGITDKPEEMRDRREDRHPSGSRSGDSKGDLADWIMGRFSREYPD